jgi:hypothetical protein
VRLITRNGHDCSGRFPQIVAAVAALPDLKGSPEYKILWGVGGETR